MLLLWNQGDYLWLQFYKNASNFINFLSTFPRVEKISIFIFIISTDAC